MQKTYYDGLNQYRDRLGDARETAAAARAEGTENKGPDRKGFMSSLMPIFRTGSTAPVSQQPTMMSRAGLGPSTLPDVDMLSSNPAAVYQSPSLASTSAAKNQAQPVQQDEDFNPIHEIVKQVGFGDLANQPDKLNAIRAAAAMHGMGKEVDPWLDSLVASKKSGIFDAAMDLKRGNIDGAMDNLKRGGIQLEDRPSRVDPNDNSKWKVNISGTGEQTINLDDWATSTLDPEKYSKFLLDRQGAADKTRLTDAQIDNQKAGAEKDRAMAKAYGAGSLGAGRRNGGAGGLTPTVRKTVETDQGIVAIMSDGSKRIISDDQGNPLFGTSGLKTAAGLIGKTIDPMSDTGEIAGKVNDLTNQLRGGKSMPAPAPSGKVRKFNPQTGQFD
ncbi:MAG: hypothetical protein J0I60_14725 [Nitrosospira sp.]|nr:hypothetical protein [Nitrosospira sp.]